MAKISHVEFYIYSLPTNAVLVQPPHTCVNQLFICFVPLFCRKCKNDTHSYPRRIIMLDLLVGLE